MEGPAAEGTEVVPVVVADVERVQTPLFLRDSDSTDMLFALEANKDSEEDSGVAVGVRGTVAMTGPSGLWMGCDGRVSTSHFSFLPCLSLLSARPLLFCRI
jgi:hypothetical protein